MTYYNDSVYDNTSNIWDLLVAGNVSSGDIFFLLFLVIAPFLLIFIISKGVGNKNSLSILAGCGVSSFMTIILFALDVVGEHVPIIAGVVFVASIIMYGVNK